MDCYARRILEDHRKECPELELQNVEMGYALMACTESPLNLVRGPAKNPEWAKLIRLGGDRVAVLFYELRKSVGTIDGIIERLHHSERESRWVVQYDLGGTELLTVRISAGRLEAAVPMNESDVENLIQTRDSRGTLEEASPASARQGESSPFRLGLRDRRGVRSLVRLVKAKHRLVSKTR